jgi:hypothetical protein
VVSALFGDSGGEGGMWRRPIGATALTPMWHLGSALTPKAAMWAVATRCAWAGCAWLIAHRRKPVPSLYLIVTSQPRCSPWTTQTSPPTSISALSPSPSPLLNLELKAAAAPSRPTMMLLINGAKEMLFRNMG